MFFYIDLTDDDKKEAIVFVGKVDCGVSCDGGSDLIYVYSAAPIKPKLLWHLETGSLGYGCAVKSFDVQNKRLTFEVFGQCALKNNSLEISDKSSAGLNKFVFTDSTRFVFEFDGRSFKAQSREVIPVGARSVMNYTSEIKINE